ncbi:reverse transcriptase domain-containing protein [Tanacetum coccineum]
MKRDTMAITHGTYVNDKRASYITKPKHPRPKAKDPMISIESWDEDMVREKVIIRDDHLDQPMVINGKLSVGCKQRLVEVLRRNVDVFAWMPVVGTAMPRSVLPHSYAERMKNSGATLQRMIGKDVEETLYKLQRVNIKLDPNECAFGMEEGKFLGYVVTVDGIKAGTIKVKPIIRGSTPEGPDQEQDANPSSLCESSAARNGDLLHSDRESSIDIDPHNKMPRKYLKNLQDQCGNEQPHGKNVKEPMDLRMIGPVGSRVEDIPNFIYSKRRSIWSSSGKSIWSSSGKAFQERRTSITNDMDYEALLVGLAAAAGRQMKHLHVFVNSKLLVDQLEGNREPKKEGAMIYKEEVMDATTPFHRFRITHLPKALIPKTEALTRLATIQLGFLNQEVSVGVKTRPSIEAPDKPFDETKNLLKKATLGKCSSTWEDHSGSN